MVFTRIPVSTKVLRDNFSCSKSNTYKPLTLLSDLSEFSPHDVNMVLRPGARDINKVCASGVQPLPF